jgi:hypothetical protein
MTRSWLSDMRSILVVRPSGATVRSLPPRVVKLQAGPRYQTCALHCTFESQSVAPLTDNSNCFFLQMMAAARVVFYQSLHLSFYYFL